MSNVELLEAAGYEPLRAGTYSLALGVLDSYADLVSSDGSSAFHWYELTIKRRRGGSLTYRINPDDYISAGMDELGRYPTDEELTAAVDADVRAALRGLINGQVRARWLGDGLELLVPRRAGWELVSQSRSGFFGKELPLDEIGDLTGFVDVRTFGGELPDSVPTPTTRSRRFWR